jgi:hypothetical protein
MQGCRRSYASTDSSPLITLSGNKASSSAARQRQTPTVDTANHDWPWILPGSLSRRHTVDALSPFSPPRTHATSSSTNCMMNTFAWLHLHNTLVAGFISAITYPYELRTVFTSFLTAVTLIETGITVLTLRGSQYRRKCLCATKPATLSHIQRSQGIEQSEP